MKSALTFMAMAIILFFSPRHLYAAETTNLNCGLNISFDSTNSVDLGRDIPWSLAVTNTSGTSITCLVSLVADAVAYDGDLWTNIFRIDQTVAIPPGNSQLTVTNLTAREYMQWPEATIRAYAVVDTLDREEVWITLVHTFILSPTNVLSIEPSAPIHAGQTVSALVNYANPFSFPLNNANIHFTVSCGSDVQDSDVPMGSVNPGSPITASKNFLAEKTGAYYVWISITADNLSTIDASDAIDVVR